MDNSGKKDQSGDLISIIVPIYRTEDYLRDCMDSILQQTYSNLEILLIEDGSKDQCAEICDEYADKDDRVRVFHTENNGLSAARNLGLSKAQGKFVGFVDSDDWIEPDMFGVMHTRLNKSGADMCVSGFWHEMRDSSIPITPNDMTVSADDALKYDIIERVSSYVWNRLFRRELFEGVLFPVGRVYEDVDIMYKLVLAAETVTYIPDLLYHYRHCSSSISNSHTMKRMSDFWVASRDRYLYLNDMDRFKDDPFFLDHVLLHSAQVISLVWLNAYGTGQWREYADLLQEMSAFARERRLPFGKKHWPYRVRFGVYMSRSNSEVSLFLSYLANRIYCWIKPEHLF